MLSFNNFNIQHCHTELYKNSFFVQMVVDWNHFNKWTTPQSTLTLWTVFELLVLLWPERATKRHHCAAPHCSIYAKYLDAKTQCALLTN